MQVIAILASQSDHLVAAAWQVTSFSAEQQQDRQQGHMAFSYWWAMPHPSPHAESTSHAFAPVPMQLQSVSSFRLAMPAGFTLQIIFRLTPSASTSPTRRVSGQHYGLLSFHTCAPLRWFRRMEKSLRRQTAPRAVVQPQRKGGRHRLRMTSRCCVPSACLFPSSGGGRGTGWQPAGGGGTSSC